MKKFICAAALCLAISTPVAAQTWSSNAPHIGPINQPEGMLIHPYPSPANYCPTGLQPVTLGGVICCGAPNTSETYYNRAGGRRYMQMGCSEGQKGCS